MHVANYEEMVEVIVYRSFTRPRGGPTTLVKGTTAHGNKKLFGTKIKVNTCTNFVLGCLK